MIRAGYGYDLSSLLDDDEERKRAQEAAAAEPPAPEPGPDVAAEEAAGAAAQAAAAPAQPSAPEPSAGNDDLSALLSGYDYSAPAVDIEPPPQRERPSEGPAALGLALDVLLNKGRHVPQMIAQFGAPQDVDYENWKRRLEWAKARAGRGAGVNPMSLAIRAEELKARRQALALQAQGVGIRQAAQTTREKGQARDIDPTNPQTKATRDVLYSTGHFKEGSLDQLDGKALGQLMSLLKQDATTRSGSPLAQQDTQHAAEKAGAVSAATLADDIKRAEAAAAIQANKETTENAELSQITGWHRVANAPELKPAESEGLRKTDAAAEQYHQALQRLRNANSKLGAGDYAQAALGKHSPAMAEALAAHSDVLTKQRQLENLGTPQVGEMKMVNKQVPPPDTFGGAMNGDAQYGALLNEYEQNHAALMNKYGYERDTAPAAASPAPSAPRKRKPRPQPAAVDSSGYQDEF